MHEHIGFEVPAAHVLRTILKLTGEYRIVRADGFRVDLHVIDAFDRHTKIAQRAPWGADAAEQLQNLNHVPTPVIIRSPACGLR